MDTPQSWILTAGTFLAGTALPVIFKFAVDLFTVRAKTIAEERNALFDEYRKWKDDMQKQLLQYHSEVLQLQRDNVDCVKTSASLSTQVTSLQHVVEDLSKTRQQQQDTIDGLQARLLNLTEENTRLSQENAELKAKLVDLQSELADLRHLLPGNGSIDLPK